ncbi:MAG: hypothetical protein P0Y53_17090 [Candidatus Pseudobacter hemicellulosilyticus]|uniref:Uncharacterized protein n=1 Tax=Candidatus Pseudobacter hemicellulosilyticus TaxID=3121375 RepID=A0AAJ6BE36_9BACT|nr:MAG: hypothetical protein P0Y53_17090 [Pseudobacter sp.]
MKYEVYQLSYRSESGHLFEFVSIGKRGNIRKRVEFQQTQWSNVFNLAFGDVDDMGALNDRQVTDNGDMVKVLATIGSVVREYASRHPERSILIVGSTPGRARLYRMALALNEEELSAEFGLFTFEGMAKVPFQKGTDIDTFLINLKQ